MFFGISRAIIAKDRERTDVPFPNAKGVNDVKKKKPFGPLLICIVLLAGAIMLSLAVTRTDGEGFMDSNPVIISEILASNRTYVAPNGQLLDYIEVHNTTNAPIDISGYKLGDQPDSIGYTFPSGSILQADSYLICWCDKESESENYAKFGISKKGEDTIYLYNDANVLIDQAEVPQVNDNVPLIREADGSWSLGVHATPGFANTEEGFAAWLESKNTKELPVVISEVMTGSGYTIIDGSGAQSDWVELLNTGTSPVDLSGAYLSDDGEDRAKWQIPSLVIGAGERVLIRCAGSEAGENDADFALSRDGCTLVLTGVNGNTIDLVEVPKIGKDCAWALQEDGSYLETTQVTPGYENTTAGYEAWVQSVGATTPDIRISEVMTANRSTLLNEDGQFCDWIELYNPTAEAIQLGGLYLSNDPADRMKWALPDTTLASGARMVIRCSGGNAPAGDADFALSKAGCTVILSGSVGNVIAQVEVPRMEEDRTYALHTNGTYEVCDQPSPGYPNDEAGYLAFRNSQTVPGGLIISEVMPSNCGYLQQSDGEYYDWVELKNVSEGPIRLSDYALSDDPEDLQKFTLPDVTLESGECYVVICSGYTDLTNKKYVHAPFTLSREESWVYLSETSESGCHDHLRIYDVPYQHSVGRSDGENGTYYFTTPTPGTSNGSGVAFISATPQVLTADGVYNDVESVAVELNGDGVLYYTTDGSVPDSDSKEYSGPITLTKTTSLRVVSIENGKLPSDVVTAVYIINENHTLPVFSIVADPDALFHNTKGIYTNYKQDKEVPCTLSLFEGEGGFTIDCGVKMHGHTGLEAPKKSFKINFRGRYGADLLEYPLWGADAPQTYDSLLIRAGQDYPTAIFREELFSSLALEMSDSVLAQREKFGILYINGEYYGIYNMKEAWTELMYAQNMGGSAENVEIVQAPVSASHEIYELNQFCKNNDMTVEANYEYVASKVDIDSLIDWMILEGYSTNGDVQQNLRYIRSADTGGKWQFALYDLDWAFYYHNAFKHVLSPHQSWQHLTLTRNIMENPTFRAKFLARCSEVMATTLSNEHVTERIDYYENLLDPEVARERKRWTSSYDAWKNKVQYLRDFINIGEDGYDQMDNMINKLIDYIGLTDAEIETYFSRWR